MVFWDFSQMVSPAFLLITCLLSLSFAKHKHDRSQRANLAAWKTTECAILNGQHTEPCPSPNPNGEWPCIRYSDLCDGQRDCPNGEDESAVHCYFHELHRAELDAIRERTHRMIVEFNRRTKPL